MLDTYREVLTPEGVALHLPAAGPVPRALALADRPGRAHGHPDGAVDGAGRARRARRGPVPDRPVPPVLGLSDRAGSGWNGQTFGKRALGLRVVAGDGAPVGWLPAVVRNLMRTVDMLPFGYATGLVACLCDRHGPPAGRPGRRHRSRARASALRPSRACHRPCRWRRRSACCRANRPRSSPSASGHRACRRGAKAELAALLYPLTGSAGGEGVRRLYGIAGWLLGRR